MKRGKRIIGDDGDREYLCKHGVGHGPNVHTCDGEKCCREAQGLPPLKTSKKLRKRQQRKEMKKHP